MNRPQNRPQSNFLRTHRHPLCCLMKFDQSLVAYIIIVVDESARHVDSAVAVDIDVEVM